MAKSGSLILYQYLILGGGLGSSTTAQSGPSYQADLSKTTFNWTVASQDIVNNTSTINWTLTVENLKNYSLTSFTINDFYIYDYSSGSGVQLYYNGTAVTINLNSPTIVYSGSLTLNHKSDGTLSMPLRIKAYMNAKTSSNTYYSNSAIDKEFTISPDTIPRHAVLLSAPEKFTDEDSPAITFAIPTGATDVKAYISFSTSTIDIGSYAISGSSYTFKFTDAEKRKLWSILDQGLNTKPMYFYVTSKYQGTLYHSGPIISTLEIGNYKPTIDPEVWDSNTDVVNRLTGNQYILVKGVSNASYTTGGSARKGATIDTQTTTNGGITKYGASGVFEAVTGNVFDFVITDSRGNSTPATMEFSKAAGKFVDYVKLTCSTEVSEMTADGDVQVKITGKCFNGSFGKLTNRLRVNYDISENGDDFTHVDLGYATYASNYGHSYSQSGNNYTYILNLTGLNYQSVYDLTVRVSDEVEVTGVTAETILASTPIFDWGRTDFNFNVDVTAQKNLTVEGDIYVGGCLEIADYIEAQGGLDVAGYISLDGHTVPSITAQGTSNGWTYRKWTDGVAECWRTLSLTNVDIKNATAGTSSSATAGWFASGNLTATNLSFPFSFTSQPSVTATVMPTGTSWAILFPGSTASSTTTTGSYQLLGTSPTTAKSYTISYQVKGKWK